MTAHNTNLVLIPHTANDWIDPRIVRAIRRQRLSNETVERCQEQGRTDIKPWIVRLSTQEQTASGEIGISDRLYYFDTEEQADDAIAAIVGQND